MYSASASDKAIVDCLLLAQDIRLSPSVASFFGDKAIWLAFDSLIYFTTEHLIFFRKGGKKFKPPHIERFRVRGLVIFMEGVSTLNIHSIL